jgi:hypothetical protein
VRAAIRTLLTILSLLFATMALTYTAKFVVIFIHDIFTHPAFPLGFFLEDAVDSFYSDQWPAAMPSRSCQLVLVRRIDGCDRSSRRLFVSLSTLGFTRA